jgi:hypothetical protein
MIFNTLRPASKQILLDKVSELDIFLLFCPNFKCIGRPFQSPIEVNGRPNTGSGAAVIFQRNGSLRLHDFRAGESYDPFSFVMLMTGLDFRDTVGYLCDTFAITNSGIAPAQKRELVSRNIISESPRNYSIEVKYENWTYRTLQYWKDYGWQPYMLDKAKIRPIERFWMSSGDDYRSSYTRPEIGPISFSYDFYEIDGIFRRKIYNPLTKQKNLKWKNNTNKNIIQALNTIDYHVDTLYIVSSMKDCGPYWTILNKPVAIAPNSESTLMSPEQIRVIRQISDKQIIWLDNDPTGIHNARKQANLYGFECKWNPIGRPKDQSDLVKKEGLREFNKLLK